MRLCPLVSRVTFNIIFIYEILALKEPDMHKTYLDKSANELKFISVKPHCNSLNLKKVLKNLEKPF